MNASDFLAERLYQWGISVIYGYPGDEINGVMEALNQKSIILGRDPDTPGIIN